MKRIRNTNIEWLRIIAIVLITFNHIYNKGVDKEVILNTYKSVNAGISVFFLMGGKYGCNIFLIISAWFLAEKDINWRAAIHIWIQTVFYTLVLDIISVAFFHAELSKRELLATIFPLSLGTYWYSLAYVIMLLLGPPLRKVFNLFGKFRLPALIGGGIALSVIPSAFLEGTITGADRTVTLLFKALTYPPIWFLYVFILIGFVKERAIRKPEPRTSISIALALYICMFLVTLALFHGVGSGEYPEGWQFATWRQLNSPLCFMSAFFLFVAACEAKPTSRPIVNHLAGCTYGIYLFQCHKTFQGMLWRKILRFEQYYTMPTISYIAYCIFGVCIIMSLGIALEYLFKWSYVQIQKAIPVLG